MSHRNRARRPAQWTARLLCESLPGMVAFYADSLVHSMVEGFALTMRGRPHHVGAFGTIETMVRTLHDRPVVLDARTVIGAPERIVGHNGRERSEVTVALGDGRTVRIGFDVPRDRFEDALRRARG